MTTEKNLVPMAFKFNATSQEVRSFLVEHNPWFVAKDVCDVLGIKNSRLAIVTLDEDEKLTYKIYTSGQNRKTWLISESGLYALIMRSSKPEARTFRKWVTGEVLPAIRKKGYYSTSYSPTTFVDVRDVPFTKTTFNGFSLRIIKHNNQEWYSLTDIHKCIGSQTCITQAVKKLNAKQVLAKKMWIFGATHPAWFTNKLGFNLIVSGSRVFNNNQLSLLP